MLRCSEGRFILGYSCFFGEMTSLQAKLKALIFGVRLAIDHGYSDLQLESDSLVLVQILQGKSRCPWQLQGDLQDLLKVKRFVRKVSYCFREANKPAVHLANIGADSGTILKYDSLRELPRLVRGDFILDQIGVPSLRRVKVGVS